MHSHIHPLIHTLSHPPPPFVVSSCPLPLPLPSPLPPPPSTLHPSLLRFPPSPLTHPPPPFVVSPLPSPHPLPPSPHLIPPPPPLSSLAALAACSWLGYFADVTGLNQIVLPQDFPTGYVRVQRDGFGSLSLAEVQVTHTHTHSNPSHPLNSLPHHHPPSPLTPKPLSLPPFNPQVFSTKINVLSSYPPPNPPSHPLTPPHPLTHTPPSTGVFHENQRIVVLSWGPRASPTLPHSR